MRRFVTPIDWADKDDVTNLARRLAKILKVPHVVYYVPERNRYFITQNYHVRREHWVAFCVPADENTSPWREFAPDVG